MSVPEHTVKAEKRFNLRVAELQGNHGIGL